MAFTGAVVCMAVVVVARTVAGKGPYARAEEG
jgi:hypothetical protein